MKDNLYFTFLPIGKGIFVSIGQQFIKDEANGDGCVQVEVLIFDSKLKLDICIWSGMALADVGPEIFEIRADIDPAELV